MPDEGPFHLVTEIALCECDVLSGKPHYHLGDRIFTSRSEFFGAWERVGPVLFTMSSCRLESGDRRVATMQPLPVLMPTPKEGLKT